MRSLSISPKVVLFDPAISSLNLGDEIISASARAELGPLLANSYVVDISTHLPVSPYLRLLKGADHRFVLGSNLLRGRMNRLFRQWDVHIGYAHWVAPATLMGVGWWQYGDRPNSYTRRLYQRLLSRDLDHSVRDSYTAHMMQSMGFDNVLMTGCPTMWRLTPDHCAAIPRRRSETVVTTLTDYNKQPDADAQMLRTLLAHYDRVRFWPQGYNDGAYLASLGLSDPRLEILSPNLSSYDGVLVPGETDFVGTRLHAGIRALQRGCRTLVVSIDNRAQEKAADFALPVVARGDFSGLERWISGDQPTDIRLPMDSITRWKNQFGLDA